MNYEFHNFCYSGGLTESQFHNSSDKTLRIIMNQTQIQNGKNKNFIAKVQILKLYLYFVLQKNLVFT